MMHRAPEIDLQSLQLADETFITFIGRVYCVNYFQPEGIRQLEKVQALFEPNDA